MIRVRFAGQEMKMSVKHFSADRIDCENLSQEDQDIMDAIIKSPMMFGVGVQSHRGLREFKESKLVVIKTKD